MMLAADLEWTRLPVRLTIFQVEQTNSVPVKLHGVIADDSSTKLTIETTLPLPLSFQDALVGVEVLHSKGLFRFDSVASWSVNDRLTVCVQPPVPRTLEWVQRRQHVRTPARLICGLHKQYHDQFRDATWAVTKNISSGGLAIETDYEVTVGDRMFVGFHGGTNLPDHPLLVEVVRVVRPFEGGYWVALRFVELSNDDIQQIERFVLAHQEP